MIPLKNRIKEVLKEIHSKAIRANNKTVGKFGNDDEKWCRNCRTGAAVKRPRCRNRGVCGSIM